MKSITTVTTMKKIVNSAALSVTKYYKNQKPPEDQVHPFVDEKFPPTIDSLLPKVIRLGSSLLGLNVAKEFTSQTLYSKFNFKKEEIQWYRASEIFPDGRFTIFENKVEVNDILQGNIGNCYFMSSLAAMCKNPQLIMELFRDLSVTVNGCYEVVMRIDGCWQVVIIDDYFPCYKSSKKPLFAQSNGSELWVMLLEKAWAKVNGCYFNTIGGWSSEVLFSLTSFPVYTINHENLDKDKLWSKIKYLSERDNIITCTSKEDPSMEKFGLICGHSFTIIKLKEGLVRNRLIKLIRIRNPYGCKEP